MLYIWSPFALKRTRGGTMPWKQTIHLTCKWKLYNRVKITSFVALFNCLERLQNFCVNRINDHSDGYFYTQLITSSSLSVCLSVCMQRTVQTFYEDIWKFAVQKTSHRIFSLCYYSGGVWTSLCREIERTEYRHTTSEHKNISCLHVADTK